MIFNNIESFMEWYQGLNPDEQVDIHEAYTIYFNLEKYVGETL